MRRRAPSPYDAHCTMRWVLVKLPSFSERRILEPRRGHPACSNALTGGVGSCHRFAKDRSPESVDSLIRMCSSYLQAPTGTLLFPGPNGPEISGQRLFLRPSQAETGLNPPSQGPHDELHGDGS